MSARCKAILLLIIALSIAAGCRSSEPTATPAPASTPMPPLSGSGGGVIAFVSDRDEGDWEIYAMNADGTDQRRLTKQRFRDHRPAWSPDGTQIAFTSRRKGNEDIFVMDVEDALQGTGGTNVWRLTANPANEWSPAWSPDGAQIVFVSARDGNSEIYVVDVQQALQDPGGADQRRLTHNDVDDDNPSWSPSPSEAGGQIAFVSRRDGNDEIYVMGADGSGQQRLTHNDVDDWWPVWSPDGSQIAFTSAREGDYATYLMDADGGNQRRLTNNDGDDWRPGWSPDGARIAFQSNPGGQWDIYVIHVEDALQGVHGTDRRRLTTGGASDQHPVWQP
jgi:Tol biopolymer transport system component